MAAFHLGFYVVVAICVGFAAGFSLTLGGIAGTWAGLTIANWFDRGDE